MSPAGAALRIALLGAWTAAFVVPAAAPASTGAVPVRLSVAGGAGVQVGTPIAVTAIAKLAKGSRLVIRGTRSSGGAMSLKECTRSPCAGTWRETAGGQVTFQAFLQKGAKVLGRSAKVVASWFSAVPGHYEGRTSQNEIFRFDVAPDGRSLTGLQTGQINQSCEPYRNLGAGSIHDWKGTIGLDGTFTIHQTGEWGVYTPPVPGTYELTIAGRISGGLASGTFRFNSAFTYDRTAYTCTSGDQTWNATKT